MGKKYFNGLKTMGLFVVMWVVLLAVGSLHRGRRVHVAVR